MNSFDDIPEDRELSFPCPEGCGGDVTQNILNKKNGGVITAIGRREET